MKNFTKNIVLWIIVGLLLVALFNFFQGTPSKRAFTEIQKRLGVKHIYVYLRKKTFRFKEIKK